MLGRGNTDFYKLSCDVTVCDIDETGDNTCEKLRANCDEDAVDFGSGTAVQDPEIEFQKTIFSVAIETDEMWSEEYDDLSSESYTTLAASVSDAVTTTFEDSAAEGYELTKVVVMLVQGDDGGKRQFLKKVFVRKEFIVKLSLSDF